MLTSRSEYRLILRSDNADERMSPIGREWGLLDDRRWGLFQEKQGRIQAEHARLAATRVPPTAPVAVAVAEASGQNVTLNSSLAVRFVALLRLLSLSLCAIALSMSAASTVSASPVQPLSEAPASLIPLPTINPPQELLRRPHVHYPLLLQHGAGDPALSQADQEAAEITIKYSGFIDRQQKQMDMARKATTRATG